MEKIFVRHEGFFPDSKLYAMLHLILLTGIFSVLLLELYYWTVMLMFLELCFQNVALPVVT